MHNTYANFIYTQIKFSYVKLLSNTISKLIWSKFQYRALQDADGKGAGQTVHIHMLVCASVVRMQQNHTFPCLGQNNPEFPVHVED